MTEPGPDDALLGGNRLLAALPDEERAALAVDMDVVEYSVRETVYEQGQPVEHVVFPVAAVLSLVSTMSDDRAVEVATVGNEGMIGLPVFLQATMTSAHMAFAQVPGQALVMPAERFSERIDGTGTLHRLLHRYTQALISQIAQGAACGSLHTAEQRACRWLLMTHDRVPGDEFLLTQEFLGQMLAVSRPTVNEVAQLLQDEGLISYARGRMTVLDRGGLERRSCECYGVIAAEFKRLLPSD